MCMCGALFEHHLLVSVKVSHVWDVIVMLVVFMMERSVIQPLAGGVTQCSSLRLK